MDSGMRYTGGSVISGSSNMDPLDSDILYTAVTSGDEDLVSSLLKEVTVLDTSKINPLILATRMNYLSIFKMILNISPNIVNTTVDGWSSLHFAAADGSLDILQELCSQDSIVINTVNNNVTPLILAIQRNHIDAVRILINHKDCDINFADKDGWSALSFAILDGQVEIVKLLISAGCDINLETRKGNTPLILACQHNYTEIAILLLNCANIDITKVDYEQWSALHWAAYQGNLILVKLLVSRSDCNINQRTQTGYSALLLAASNHHLDVVNFLTNSSGHESSIVSQDHCPPCA